MKTPAEPRLVLTAPRVNPANLVPKITARPAEVQKTGLTVLQHTLRHERMVKDGGVYKAAPVKITPVK